MSKRVVIKVDPNAVVCRICKKMAVPKYKVTAGGGKFCSLECLKKYFNNIESVNYENHKITN